jgi:hypothetical protein
MPDITPSTWDKQAETLGICRTLPARRVTEGHVRIAGRFAFATEKIDPILASSEQQGGA